MSVTDAQPISDLSFHQCSNADGTNSIIEIVLEWHSRTAILVWSDTWTSRTYLRMSQTFLGEFLKKFFAFIVSWGRFNVALFSQALDSFHLRWKFFTSTLPEKFISLFQETAAMRLGSSMIAPQRPTFILLEASQICYLISSTTRKGLKMSLGSSLSTSDSTVQGRSCL